MDICPNCGRRTARTEDWACQWCGYPLLSKSYKKIPKTYKQLQEERKGFTEDELPSTPQPEPGSEAPPERVRPKPEPAPQPKPILTPKPEPKPVPPPEPVAMPMPKPEPLVEPGLEAALQPEPVTEPGPEPPPQPVAVPTLEPEPGSSTIKVTVEGLNAALKADKATAHAKLTDKILWVTGIVDKVVVKEHLDVLYIMLTSANRKELWNVRCTFNKGAGPELMRLTAGQPLTVQGKYDGYKINILLRDCALVR